MKRSGGVGASAGERGAAIGRKEKDNAEDTEFAEKRNPRVRRRGGVALERRSPPFAKGAKDGAPSSSWVGGVTRRTQVRGSRPHSKKGEEP